MTTERHIGGPGTGHGASHEDKNPPASGNTTGTALAVVDFGDDAGAGMEGAKAEEFIVPFLTILQGLSPACKPVKQGGIPGAKPGLLFNSATGQMWNTDGEGTNPEYLIFVPVFRDHNYPEFTPRDAGGGFHGIRLDTDPYIVENKAKYRFGKIPTPAGTELVETYYLFGFLIDAEDNWYRVGIAFSSTQIKKYNRFMTRYDAISYNNGAGGKVKPPIWAHRWRISTAYETNKKGEFFGWNLTLDSDDNRPLDALIKRDDPLYIAGKAFYEDLKSGRAKAADLDPSNTSGDPAGADDEIPF